MSETEERTMNLKHIGLTAAITGLVAVSTGMLLFYLQRQDPHLTYSVTDALTFMGDTQKLAIYNVTVRNGGQKGLSDVDCHVSVAPAVVKESRASLEPSIPFTEKASGGVYEIHLKSLNPQEEATLSVLASSTGEFPHRPKVSLRGQGVTGKQAEENEKRSLFEGPVFTAVVSAYMVVLVLGLVLYARRKGGLHSLLSRALFDDASVHSGDQNEILAYLCGLHGLTAEAEAYLSRSRDSSYWSESDRIAAVALSSQDASETERRKNVLRDLLQYAEIAARSVGIVHYNIARIAKSQGHADECEGHLEKAREALPKLTDTRLRIDPVFLAQANDGQPSLPESGDRIPFSKRGTNRGRRE